MALLETTLDFIIAIYSIFAAIIFLIMSVKQHQLFTYNPSVSTHALGSIFIYTQIFNENYRIIGNIFYAIALILFLIHRRKL